MLDKATQRTGNFRGGIPQGLSATTVESRGLEVALQVSVKSPEVQALLQKKNLRYIKGLKGAEVAEIVGVSSIEHKLSGLSPDGGMIINQAGIPVVSSEAKKQGRNGNAIERFAKNHLLLKTMNPDVKNLVFIRGEGFFDGNSAERIMNTLFLVENAMEIENGTFLEQEWWNYHRGNNLRLYRFKEDEFETTAILTMKHALLVALQQI